MGRFEAPGAWIEEDGLDTGDVKEERNILYLAL